MLYTVLYAIDFSDFYYENLDCFVRFSKLGLKEIILIHVIDIDKLQHSLYSIYKKEDEDKIRNMAVIKLGDIKKNLEKLGLVARYVIRLGNTADEIANEANRENVDFVVLDKKAAEKPSSYFSFYGSPLYEIILKVNKLILITKRVVMRGSSLIKSVEDVYCKNTFNDIVFATDFSDFSFKAIPFINKIPEGVIKMMTFLTVLDERILRDDGYKNFEKEVAEKFDDLINSFKYQFTKEKSNLEVIVRKGIPYKEITDFIIQAGKDLLVIGFRGRDKENLKEIFFGSTAEKIVSALPCSILIVK
ncbi:MAG: universal stress protein [bacterium]